MPEDLSKLKNEISDLNLLQIVEIATFCKEKMQELLEKDFVDF